MIKTMEQLAKEAGFSNHPTIKNTIGVFALDLTFIDITSKLEAFAKAYNAQECEGWISVDDRLPEVDEWYLIFVKDKFSTMAFLDTYHETGQTVWLPHNNNAQQEVENVTHWQPLPSAPTKGE